LPPSLYAMYLAKREGGNRHLTCAAVTPAELPVHGR